MATITNDMQRIADSISNSNCIDRTTMLIFIDAMEEAGWVHIVNSWRKWLDLASPYTSSYTVYLVQERLLQDLINLEKTHDVTTEERRYYE